ncbi:hypothetical protein DRJ17_04955 [Candidatus Woesearchaeota archaeon]|nr:MAG: hypothetical protein DRJ17_04955 [Candidatus Woesearchaeota archaeon]
MLSSIGLLKRLTDKNNIILLDRGNTAIKLALEIARLAGKKNVLLQDQGGWLTYKQFSKKLKMKIVYLKTDYGLVLKDDLMKKSSSDAVLLVNYLAGYHAEQNIGMIQNACSANECMLINDVTGMPVKDASVGDIIIASFGKAKPINLGYGGMLAANFEIDDDLTKKYEAKRFNDAWLEELSVKLKGLNRRLKFLLSINKKIKKELVELGFEVLHPNHRGLNVIALFKNAVEREKLIKYCEMNNYEFVECPKQIKVLANAISIEVKRL